MITENEFKEEQLKGQIPTDLDFQTLKTITNEMNNLESIIDKGGEDAVVERLKDMFTIYGKLTNEGKITLISDAIELLTILGLDILSETDKPNSNKI